MSAFKLIDYSQAGALQEVDQISVATAEQLRDVLNGFREPRPRIVHLVSPEGNLLTIGVGGEHASVGFTEASGDPPYLMARGTSDDYDTDVEFSLGGTPTPIAMAYILPFDKMVAIAEEFLSTGKLPAVIEWEEV